MISFRVDVSNGLRRTRKAYPAWSKRVHNALRKQAKKIVLRARFLAPAKSRRLANAIYGRAYKKPLKVIIGISPSLVSPSGFPYPLFVTGKTVIRVVKDNKFFAVGQTVRYGFPALSPSGRPVVWGASPRWWEGVETYARRSIPQVANHASKEFSKEFNTL